MQHTLRFDPWVVGSILDPLLPALQAIDLPAPTTVVVFRPPERIAYYGVTLSDGRALLVQVALGELDGNGFYAALAAAKLADGEGIGFVRPFVALPWSALGAPALVSGLPTGVNTQRRVVDGTLSREAAFGAIGRMHAVIGSVSAPSFGTLATVSGFRSRRVSWSDEWMARVRRHAEIARREGAGRLVAQLVDRIDPSVLIDVAPVLVHGGLGPGELFVDAHGTPTAVLGWHDSWAGDPLSGFGPLLHLPASGLAAVLEGYGKPVDAGRLAAYECAYAVQLLAQAAMGAMGPLQASARVETAADVARLALAGTLGARLAEVQTAGAAGPAMGPHAARVRVRAALEAVRRLPAQQDGGLAWQAVAGTALLAHDLAATPAGPGWQEVADQMLNLLPDGHQARPTVGIVDRSAWWRSRFGHALQVADDGPVWTDALGLLWTAWLASERLVGAVDDGVLEGVDDLLGGAVARQRTGSPTGSTDRLKAAILGLGALEVLGRTLGDPGGVGALTARLQVQARDAWDVLEVAAPEALPGAAAIVGHYAEPSHHNGLTIALAPLLMALRHATTLGLPAHPGALLAGLGVTVP